MKENKEKQIVTIKGKQYNVMVYRPKLWRALISTLLKHNLPEKYKYKLDGKGEIRMFPFGRIAVFDSDDKLHEFLDNFKP